MPYADLPFVLAIAAIGFGLSLCTYRLFASHYQWPMGEWHESRPALPILIGLAAVAQHCRDAGRLTVQRDQPSSGKPPTRRHALEQVLDDRVIQQQQGG